MLHWYLVWDRECTAHDLFVPPSIAFGNWEVAFFFRPDDLKDLARNLSVAMTWLDNSPDYGSIKLQNLGLGKACPEAEIADDTQITFKSMRGVFLIFIVLVTSALLLAIGHALIKKRRTAQTVKEMTHSATHGEMPHATDGEMLRMLLGEFAAIKGALVNDGDCAGRQPVRQPSFLMPSFRILQ